MIRQKPILQEKNRCNSLGLYHYCDKPRYIAIDHRNSALLNTKRQVASALMGNSMPLVLHKPLSVEEKETSLS